ncbi:MAG: hypothetical protein CMJ54_10845 [Planctomycetaceae bacterium]|nr:hypothetical protein [Planctomycetaceae bacterium]
MTPPAAPIEGGEPGLFTFTAEVALFIAAIFLTLLVVGFVAALIVSIMREERGAADDPRKDEGE